MKCPDCSTEMESRGTFASGRYSYHELHQCPKCKRVELEFVNGE